MYGNLRKAAMYKQASVIKLANLIKAAREDLHFTPMPPKDASGQGMSKWIAENFPQYRDRAMPSKKITTPDPFIPGSQEVKKWITENKKRNPNFPGLLPKEQQVSRPKLPSGTIVQRPKTGLPPYGPVKPRLDFIELLKKLFTQKPHMPQTGIFTRGIPGYDNMNDTQKDILRRFMLTPPM